MAKQKIKLIAKIIISLAIAAYLIVKVDWSLLWKALINAQFALYNISIAIAFISEFLLAWKYYILIQETPISRSILSLVKINLVSRLYSIFLPPSLGPAIVRWYKITGNNQERAFFTAATIFERLTFLFALILFGSLPLVIASSQFEAILSTFAFWPKLAILLTITIPMILYFLVPAFQALINHLIYKVIISKFKKSQKFASFFQHFSLKKRPLPLFLKITTVNFIWHCLYILRVYLLFKAIYLPLNFIVAAWMGPLVFILQVLPISFAGIGVREGAYAYLFTLFHLRPENGVLIGILFFSQMLALAGTGGLFELWAKLKRNKSDHF